MSTQEQNELLEKAINHFHQQSQKIVELSRGMMALIVTLNELLPGFEEKYAEHHQAAGLRLEIEGFGVPTDLFDQLLAGFPKSDS